MDLDLFENPSVASWVAAVAGVVAATMDTVVSLLDIRVHELATKKICIVTQSNLHRHTGEPERRKEMHVWNRMPTAAHDHRNSATHAEQKM